MTKKSSRWAYRAPRPVHGHETVRRQVEGQVGGVKVVESRWIGHGCSSIEARRPGKLDKQRNEVERSVTCRNVSIEGERGSTLAQGRLATRIDKDDQHTSTSVDDVPEDPPEPPPPPNKPTEQ